MFNYYNIRLTLKSIIGFLICNVTAAFCLQIATEFNFVTSLISVFFLLISFKLFFTSSNWSLDKNDHDPLCFKYTAKHIPIHNFNASSSSSEFVRSKNVNSVLNEIIMYCIRDYVSVWYDKVAEDQYALTLVRELIEEVCKNVTKRLGNVDWENFLTQDVPLHIKEHIEKVKAAEKENKPFAVQFFLQNQQLEEEHLRNLALFLLETTMTKEIQNCKIAHILLREIITCKMLKPFIDTLSDSDVLNLWLLHFLEKRESVAKEAKKQHAYADSYEKFMAIIDKNKDMEMLAQIRLSIIAEIAEASAINSLKKDSATTPNQNKYNPPSTKAHQLMNRDLNIYIKQLTLCRVHCERRLSQIGGAYYQSLYGRTATATKLVDPLWESSKSHQHKEKKPIILEFSVVIHDFELNQFLRDYLKTQSVENLFDFWNSVVHMLSEDISKRYIVARDIFHHYVATPRPVLNFERAEIHAMEQFLLGNSEVHSFSEAAERALQIIETHWYLSFVVSREYSLLLKKWKVRKSQTSKSPVEHNDGSNDKDSLTSTTTRSLIAQSSSKNADDFQPRLALLDAKIQAKCHALEALKSYQRAHTNEELLDELSNDLRQLRFQRNAIETYQRRVNIWSAHLGGWRAGVYDLTDKNEVIIIVDRSLSTNEPRGECEGWLVTRSLAEFHQLKADLVPLASWVKRQPLPRWGVTRKLIRSAPNVSSIKASLDSFLQAIIKDTSLCQSQLLFHFLCPLPEELHALAPALFVGSKNQLAHSENTRALGVGGGWGGAGLMRSVETKSLVTSVTSDSTTDLRLYAEDVDSETSTDALFQLIRVVFEVRGANQLLRRAIVNTVRTMYGRTLGRFLSDYVTWALCDTMLVYYLEQFRNSFWPDGQSADWGPPRQEAAKLATVNDCRRVLLQSLPDFVGFLLGTENARSGTLLLFEIAQQNILNKSLLYDLLHHLLMQLFPELRGLAGTQASDVVFSVMNSYNFKSAASVAPTFATIEQ